MSRRTAAGLVSIGLIVVLGVIAALLPVPWVRFSPGPTYDVLAAFDGKQIIKVTGRKTYEDDGALRMVTVIPDGPQAKVTLVTALAGWFDRDTSVYPRSIYDETETNESVREESALQMSSSQDFATAAALDALGIDFRTDLVVAGVDEDGPAAKILKKDDVIRAIDGKTDDDPNALVTMIRETTPGESLTLTVLRDGKTTELPVTTGPATDDPKAARVGISVGSKFAFPFKVEIQLPANIGGSSAGMVFALSIYDVLTPGSLTGGKAIAGTGAITAEGVVGPIGGIGQKVAGAQRDGAELFLVPEENCAEAARAHYDPDKLRLVKIHTLKEAISAVEAWRSDPNADLPRCTR